MYFPLSIALLSLTMLTLTLMTLTLVILTLLILTLPTPILTLGTLTLVSVTSELHSGGERKEPCTEMGSVHSLHGRAASDANPTPLEIDGGLDVDPA